MNRRNEKRDWLIISHLKGQFTELRKFGVGNYSVIYSIIDDSSLILRIRHRKDVY
ncbi:MAG: type II toxin-antitoxin system RelE/ParE family toxin [Spirochaetales bacterium]|nr:type II toxin-antitoxin system RelE/ParE family toxin [Spirochaetales bacterium]